jgi:hypothetical protein
MAMNMKTALFWDVMLYILVDRYQHFEELLMGMPWIKSTAFHHKDPGSITGGTLGGQSGTRTGFPLALLLKKQNSLPPYPALMIEAAGFFFSFFFFLNCQSMQH